MRWRATSYGNAEIPGPTEVVQRARRRVREHLADRARVIGADGVLLPHGIDLAHAGHSVVEASATGSAIVRLGDHRSQERPLSTTTLPL